MLTSALRALVKKINIEIIKNNFMFLKFPFTSHTSESKYADAYFSVKVTQVFTWNIKGLYGVIKFPPTETVRIQFYLTFVILITRSNFNC